MPHGASGRLTPTELAGITSVDLATVARSRAVVLVEGTSDQAALEALAGRCGKAVGRDGICIVAMGGATNIRRFIRLLGPHGLGIPLAGLCDAAEEGHFRRALAEAGLGAASSRPELEALGFYVCDADLEDELIRALGTAAVEQIIEVHGELRSFRVFQRQPAQQGRSTECQLRRFMGTRSGRKCTYARLLVNALDPARIPRPLGRALAHV